MQICPKIPFVQDAYSDLHCGPSLHITSVAESGKSSPEFHGAAEILPAVTNKEKRDLCPTKFKDLKSENWIRRFLIVLT